MNAPQTIITDSTHTMKIIRIQEYKQKREKQKRETITIR